MLLKDIAALRAPTGWEDAAREAIRREAETLLAGREGNVFCDTMGNLYARVAGRDAAKKRVMLCAHMDEGGLIVRGATEDGLLRFSRVGRVDAGALVSKRVRVGENAVPGVIGCKPIHLMRDGEEIKPVEIDELGIDIGASSREEAERLCPKGCYATFDSEYREFGDGFVKAKALDGRVGCMLLLEVLKESGYTGELTCVFTVQEGAGMRGARVAARRVKPDLAIVVGAAAADDMGDVPAHMRSTECGKGAAIVQMDGGMIADRPLREMALAAAKARGIPVQPQRLPLGGTDAAEIHLAGEGVPCLSLGVPCRYARTCASVVKLSDIESVRRLLLAVLEEL